MERTSTSPLLLQSRFVFLEVCLTFALERPGSNVLDHVSSRAILVALVTGKRAPAHPGVPSGRTPAVPERWLDVVRGSLPFCEEVRARVVVRAGAPVEAHEVGSREGEVSEEELAA